MTTRPTSGPVGVSVTECAVPDARDDRGTRITITWAPVGSPQSSQCDTTARRSGEVTTETDEGPVDNPTSRYRTVQSNEPAPASSWCSSTPWGGRSDTLTVRPE